MSIEDHVIEILTSETNKTTFKEAHKSCSKAKDFDKNILLSLDIVSQLIDKSLDVIKDQPMLLELAPPVNICGDVHGQFLDLLWVFDCAKYPPQANYLFLGDFVDRGRYSLEIASLFMAYKIKYPTRFFFLRGNHESNSVNSHYSFKVECKTRFPKDGLELWNKFGNFFNWLPVSAVVGSKIFCTHGGLSPNLRNMDAIRKIERPCEIPNSGLLCDLVWADPDDGVNGWKFNEARSISYRFGADVVKSFLEKNEMMLIVRAHELVKDGYEIVANKQLVTLFTAPNYTGQFGNNGAFLAVGEDLECNIISMDYKAKKEQKVRKCESKPNLFDKMAR